MRRILLCIEEMVKAMRNGIAPSYVDDLKRRKAPSHVVEVIRAMWWGGLHPTLWKKWEQCAAAPNWWLVGVEVARSIDNYEGYFLSRPGSLSRMPSNPIFQAVCLKVLSFSSYIFRLYTSGSHNFLLSRVLFIFLGHLSGYIIRPYATRLYLVCHQAEASDRML